MSEMVVPIQCPMDDYCRRIVNILNKNPLDIIDHAITSEMDCNLFEALSYMKVCAEGGRNKGNYCIWEQLERLKGIAGNNARAYIWATLFLAEHDTITLTEAGRSFVRASANLKGGRYKFKQK